MTGLQETLADYLRRIGQLEAQPLGNKPRPLGQDDAAYLRDSLSRQLRFNNSMIVIAVGMLCGLFLAGAFLIYYDRDSLRAEAVISGTAFASLLGIVRFLRRLWLEKSTMDVLILASASMPPAESARLVTSFYFNSVQGRGKPAAGGA